MDLGCGKGGDLKKYNFESISNYFGVDISIRGLKDAVLRKVKSNIKFPTTFVCMSGDLQPEKFNDRIPKLMYFDLVSAQFCIHYFFSKEQCVRNFLENVSTKLTKNGIFVATFPDSSVIIKKLEGNQISNGDYAYTTKHFSLMMPIEEANKTDFFGIKYGFFMEDGLIG